jgi:hypothetical protein
MAHIKVNAYLLAGVYFWWVEQEAERVMAVLHDDVNPDENFHIGSGQCVKHMNG